MRRRRWLVPLIFALAVASGVYWGIGVPQGNDAHEYRRLADNILAGHGFSLSTAPPWESSARRAPAYPLFLALIYATFGHSDTAVLWGQAVLWGFGCILLYRLVVAAAGARSGILAGLIVAVHPALARTTGEVLTECLYTVILIALLVAFQYGLADAHRDRAADADGSRGAGWFALTGLLFGVAVLIRPLTGGFLAFLWGGLWLWRRDVRAAGRAALIVTAVGLLTLLPWTARNVLTFHRFIPVQVQGLGVNVWLATLPYDEQPIVSWAAAMPALRAKYPELRAVPEGVSDTVGGLERGRLLVRAAVGRIRESPLAYLRSRARAYPHLWLSSGGSQWLGERSFGEAWRRRELGRLAAKLGFAVVFSLAPLALAAALVWTLGFRKTDYVLWAVPLFVAVAHVPLWIEYRFALPAQPFLWGLASAVLAARPTGRAAHPPE